MNENVNNSVTRSEIQQEVGVPKWTQQTEIQPEIWLLVSKEREEITTMKSKRKKTGPHIWSL